MSPRMRKYTRRHFTIAEKRQYAEMVLNDKKDSKEIRDMDGFLIHPASIETWVLQYQLGRLANKVPANEAAPIKTARKKPIESEPSVKSVVQAIADSAPVASTQIGERRINSWANSAETVNTIKNKLADYIVKATSLEVENLQLKNELEHYKRLRTMASHRSQELTNYPNAI